MICIFYFCFIQYRVVRTLGRRRIFLGMKRLYLASSDAGQTMDGLGEIVPRADAFVAEMINSRHHTLSNGGIDGASQVTGVCRRTHLIENNPNELSGGQRQRVAFASIIAMDTDLLVIDEPTSQLDPEGTEDVFEIIKTLKNSGKTIILVEHKIDLIAEYCDEVIVMNEGKIVFNGPTQEVLSNKELLEQNAVIPQVALLGHLMNDLGKPLEQIPITIDQAVALIKQREGK